MKKGISLAVLVVTIIVLVILTAATMATINGENGVIDEARLAASDTQRQNAEDKLYMELAAVQIKAAKAGQTVAEYLNVPANKSDFLSKGITSAAIGSNKIDFVVDGQSISSDLNGNIQKTASESNTNNNENISEGSYQDRIFTSCNIAGGEFSGCRFVDCNITGGQFSNCTFEGTTKINGGSFASTFDNKYIAEGYNFIANADVATKDMYPWIIARISMIPEVE